MRILLAITMLVGAGGIIGQLLLLRELMVTFYGNELTIGVILGNWLVFEALGAYLAGRVAPGRIHLCYLAGLGSYGLLLPVAIFFARGINNTFFSLLPGETPGLLPIMLVSLALIIPVSMVHGAQYTLSTKVLRNLSQRKTEAPGKIYLFETIGSLLAGVFFSLLLSSLFHSFTIALALLVMHFFAISAYSFGHAIIHAGRTKIVAGSISLGLGLLLMFFFIPLDNFLHEQSLLRQWPGKDIIHYENSHFGNIVVTVSGGEYNLFYDGRPALTTPNPDVVEITDLISLAAGAHPQPEVVLMVGGGAGGALSLLLKHPVKKITYIELDPNLPALFMELPFETIHWELTDPRVEVVSGDARHYLKETDTDYDLILLYSINPDSLQENRLFTRTFFEEVRKKLAPGGVLVFSAPGSAFTLVPEIKPLLDSLFSTATNVFSYVEVLPGDTTLFFASEEQLLLSADLIYFRLIERELTDDFITMSYLETRFDPLKIDPFKEGLAKRYQLINEDFRPVAFYYSLYYWGGLYSPSTFVLLSRIEKLPIFFIPIILLLLLLLIKKKNVLSQKNVAILPFAVFTSGLTGMTFDMLILFLFQTLYGYVYQMIGLLVALFMTGVAIGSGLGIKMCSKKNIGDKLIIVEFLTILLHPLLYLLAYFLQVVSFRLPAQFPLFMFSFFALLSGSALGLHFPIACILAEQKNKLNPVNTNLSLARRLNEEPAGVLYASDLLGGWVAGLIVSIIMFPLLGLGVTLMIMGSIKTCSFYLVYRTYSRSND